MSEYQCGSDNSIYIMLRYKALSHMVPHLMNSLTSWGSRNDSAPQFLLDSVLMSYGKLLFLIGLSGAQVRVRGRSYGAEVGILRMIDKGRKSLKLAPSHHPPNPHPHPAHQPLGHTAQLSLRSALRHFASSMFEFYCHGLFLLPGNEAKPGGLINPSRCWAAVIGSRRKLFSLLCSQGCPAGAREEMEHSLQSINCSRANHLSEGNRKKDTVEFRVRTINNIQCDTLEKNKAADILLLRENRNAQCICRPVSIVWCDAGGKTVSRSVGWLFHPHGHPWPHSTLRAPAPGRQRLTARKK